MLWKLDGGDSGCVPIVVACRGPFRGPFSSRMTTAAVSSSGPGVVWLLYTVKNLKENGHTFTSCIAVAEV